MINEAKKDNVGCLSFLTNNVLTNIPHTIGNLWTSAKNECVKQLERKVTGEINKLTDSIVSEHDCLVNNLMKFLATDEETTKKYVSIAIEKARLDFIVEFLKEEISSLQEVLGSEVTHFEGSVSENEKERLTIQMEVNKTRLSEMKGKLHSFEAQFDEQSKVLSMLKKESSFSDNLDAYKVTKAFFFDVITFKSTVALGYISYGREFNTFTSAYTRGAVQSRLVIPYEDLVSMISHHEKPKKLSPDIYLNTEVGIKTSFPILGTLANIDEKKVNFSIGTGAMIRDRIGIGCTLEYNPIIKKYEFDTQQGFKLVHEQLARGRVNLSLLGSEVRAGVQGSVYASISVSKAVYSTDDEKLKIFANLGVTGVSAASLGLLAYFLLPPDVATTAGTAVAGQVVGGYLAAKIPKIAPNKQITQSMEVNNAGVALGVPVQTGFGGGLVFRGSGKIPILSRVPKATAPQSQAGEMQVRRRDAAPENSQ
ncbi:hypothetical protein BS639_06640 [Rouxiella silvae]|uniref:Uncharacterized protein n=2 Tax=Rouxiella silvae TaxID=1646373 RepID=A0ABX3U3T8_9GAMM|nr:hypothetical protein BS639_06640 [Rouxiella silvae]